MKKYHMLGLEQLEKTDLVSTPSSTKKLLVWLKSALGLVNSA